MDAHHGDFSPSGRRVVYSREAGGLYTVALDGSGRRRLTGDGVMPRWSPDGRWIAFQAGARIDLIRPDGSDRHTLVELVAEVPVAQPAQACSRSRAPSSFRPSFQKEFTEPVALLSTQPADLPLPRTAFGRSFNLLALRARCEQEPTHARARGSRHSGTVLPHFATFLESGHCDEPSDRSRVRSVSDQW